MIRTLLSAAILTVSVAMPASAMTIGHAASKGVAPVEAETTSPQSAMPYACDKAELNTRIEKRTCR